MKKLLLLAAMAFALSSNAQTYCPMHSTSVSLKNGNTLVINPPVFSTNHTWTLPPGNATGVLTNDGSGTLSWTVVAAGTLTSVSGSGGTTGLTLTGGPITTSGTLTLGGTLGSDHGGTGKVNADFAGQTGKALVVNVAENGYDFASIGSNTIQLFELEDDSVSNDDDALYDCDNLQASLAASANYAIDAFLYYRTDGHDGTDIRMAFTYTGSLATNGMHLSGRGAADAEGEEEVWTTSGTATVTNINQDEDAYIHIVGFVRTSTAGTLKVQFANGTEGSGRVTILKGGSYMKVSKF